MADTQRLELRTITETEFADYHQMISETFGGDDHEDNVKTDRTVAEYDRNWAALDGDQFVGAAGAFSRTMTVPGGELPVAAVTSVAVRPTHRRRGVLTSLMRAQLHDLHDRRAEPVAVLWASEALIYGRFGYGLGARGANLRVDLTRAAYRPGIDTGEGRVELLDREKALPDLRTVYDAQRVRVPGFLDRRDAWWDFVLRDAERHREGRTALRFAVVREPDGSASGYAAYAQKPAWGENGPDSEVLVRDLAASTPQGYAAIWKFLFGIDLHRRLTAGHAAADEVLPHLLLDARAAQLRVGDQLWIRVVDAGRALSARRYAVPLDVVLDLTDDFCPWNTGRWRLTGDADAARCERTHEPADLELTAAELGAIYLGGTTPAQLAAAGRIRELTPGAVARTTLAFRAEREPWCPEVF